MTEDHDILTIEEVAEYLRISERTVYDWANKGTIPCGKLGTAWRFKRTEIERWVDEKLAPKKREASLQRVSMADVLAPDRTVLSEAENKNAALDRLIDCLAETDAVTDAGALREEIYYRESLMSTGIGFNVAVPHVRLDSVRDLVMAVLVAQHPLNDYESLDEQPVRIVCMVAARPDQHGLYLKTLAAVSHALKPQEVREALLQAADPKAAYLILTQ